MSVLPLSSAANVIRFFIETNPTTLLFGVASYTPKQTMDKLVELLPMVDVFMIDEEDEHGLKYVTAFEAYDSGKPLKPIVVVRHPSVPLPSHPVVIRRAVLRTMWQDVKKEKMV